MKTNRTHAFLAAVVAAWVLACGAAQPIREKKEAPAKSTRGSQLSTYAPYPHLTSDECYRAKNHDVADLCAQWRGAIAAEAAVREAHRTTYWATVGALLSLATTIGVIVSIGQTFRALSEARKANLIAQRANARSSRQSAAALEHARRVARADLRPWFMYTGFNSNSFRNGRIDDEYVERGLMAELTFLNTGKSPASRLGLFTSHAVTDIDGEPPVFKRVDFEHEAILGPNSPVTGTARAVNTAELDSLVARRSCLWLYGYAEYEESAHEGQAYQTEVTIKVVYGGEMVDSRDGSIMPRFVGSPTGPQNRLT